MLGLVSIDLIELEIMAFVVSVAIPIPIPMPRLQCRGLQMGFYMIPKNSSFAYLARYLVLSKMNLFGQFFI